MQLRERDFDAFFDAPFRIYGPGSHYVSPMRGDLKRFLSSDANPLFKSDADFTWFTAHDDKGPVGRIMAHHHAAANATFETEYAYFGYFDCIDDAGVARMLLEAAEGWAGRHGFTTITGNFNLTAMQQIGIQTGGFEQAPYVDQVYGAPWLPKLLEANGYRRNFPMRTYEVDLDALDPETLLGPKQREILSSPDWSFAPVDGKTIGDRLDDCLEILNDGFAENPMFVPLTREEFDFQAKELKLVVDTRIAAVLHSKGKPAAVALIIPDLNPFIRATKSRIGLMTPWHFLRYRMTRERALLVYMSVNAEFQNRGVMGAVLHKAVTSLKDAGYRKLGITWIWQQNAGSLRQMERMNAMPLHETNLFTKTLTTEAEQGRIPEEGFP